MKKKYRHKKSYYNDIALSLLHRMLNVRHLHYGYFEGRLKPTLQNLPQAQENYLRRLFQALPKRGVRSILDVGCGVGGVARELLKRGYKVTCLAPDPYLTTETARLTGGRVDTITAMYENVEQIAAAPFDLILMSEACQYIDVAAGWRQNSRFLRAGGYLLVSDFFKKRAIDDPYLSKSGHDLKGYLNYAKKEGFRLINQKDITAYVAPTMDIYQGVLNQYVIPSVEALTKVVERRYPKTYKLLRRLAGQKLHFLKEKYSRQGSTLFRRYKKYVILLFQKESKQRELAREK